MNTPRHPGGTLRLPARPRGQAPALPALPSPSLSLPDAAPTTAAIPTPSDPAEAAARKQANVQREREEHAAAVVRRRQQTRDILAPLRARWPEAFMAPVPLAVGIAREIRGGLGETQVPTMQLGRALHRWTYAPGYLTTIAAASGGATWTARMPASRTRRKASTPARSSRSARPGGGRARRRLTPERELRRPDRPAGRRPDRPLPARHA